MNKNRLAIYCMYDKDGIIDEYITYCIKQLKDLGCHVIAVCNCELNDSEMKKISIADNVYIRSDEGYDVGAIADTIGNYLGWNKLKEYDELILLNDSIFGPFYDLRMVFKIMNQNKEIDFWGLTKRAKSDFDGGEKVYEEHLQLYFYVIRSTMLHSDAFQEFWVQIAEKITDFRSAIIHYEFAFTSFFVERGFSWDVYCKTPEYCTEDIKKNLSPYHYSSYHLIKNLKCPFMKRKQFTGDFIDPRYSDKSDVHNAFQYIKNELDYPEEMIWEHILRIYSIEQIMEGMRLYSIVERENNNKVTNLSYIVLDLLSDTWREKLADIHEDIVIVNNIHENRENVYPLRVAQYNCVHENLLLDKNNILTIVSKFESESKLGLVIPPMEMFGNVSYTIEKRWLDETRVKNIYEELELQVPFSHKRAPIGRIRAFVCRRELLSIKLLNELEKDMSGVVHQMLPLVAQNAGYYTQVVINKRYAENLIVNLQDMLYELWKTSKENSFNNKDIIGMKNEILANKLKVFCTGDKKIYIYGAGQLAYRVIQSIKDFANVSKIVVTDKNSNSDTLCGIPVIDFTRLEINDIQQKFIIAVGEKHNETVLKQLKKIGVTLLFIV